MSALIPMGLLANAVPPTLGIEEAGRIYLRLGYSGTDHGLDFVHAYRLWRDLGKALETAAGWQKPDTNNQEI